MDSPRRYSSKLRRLAVRLVFEARRDPAYRRSAIQLVSAHLGVNARTLRGWVRQAEADLPQRRSTPTARLRLPIETDPQSCELHREDATLLFLAATLLVAALGHTPLP